jgi:drug/metabolite transporter (DMT)-like permease
MALGRGGIAKFELMQFLQPVSGVMLAALFLGERMGNDFPLALGLVFCGVWISLTHISHQAA